MIHTQSIFHYIFLYEHFFFLHRHPSKEKHLIKQPNNTGGNIVLLKFSQNTTSIRERRSNGITGEIMDAVLCCLFLENWHPRYIWRRKHFLQHSWVHIDQDGRVNVRLYVLVSCFIYEGWCGVWIRFHGFILFLCCMFGAFLCGVLIRLVWLRNIKRRQDPTALKSTTESCVFIFGDVKGYLLEMHISLKHCLVAMISKLRMITDRNPVKGNLSFNNPFSYLSWLLEPSLRIKN